APIWVDTASCVDCSADAVAVPDSSLPVAQAVRAIAPTKTSTTVTINRFIFPPEEKPREIAILSKNATRIVAWISLPLQPGCNISHKNENTADCRSIRRTYGEFQMRGCSELCRKVAA